MLEDTKEALRQRLLRTKPEDQIAGMFCESAFLAMSELLGREEAESMRAAVWPIWEWVGVARYPMADLLRLADAAADRLASQGELSYGKALEVMGERMTGRVLQLPLIKAYRMSDSGNAHDRLAFSIKSSQFICTYGERRYESLGPNQGRLILVRELLGPSWVLGLYKGTVKNITSVRTTVFLEACWEPGLEFHLFFSW
ncbi:DUF2378 family protein [Archangium lipolyticum]|uniref:DUF2378 family protein n=1 Tax=Archangium lipolyticum TaxID=2970465 RepID=UPI002149B712|nr:DUF2378 family protein [Archangium lipolyticum]